MIPCRDRTRDVFGVFAPEIGSWQQMKSRRCAHTSLRLVSPMRTMASMWEPVPLFTIAPSHLTGVGARWKRFLSHASHTVIRYG